MPEIKIKVKWYKCNNYGYEWLSCSLKERPLIYPKCRFARLDKKHRKKK